MQRCEWVMLSDHAKSIDPYYVLGELVAFLHEDDPRSAQEQLDMNYHFGGFVPFDGFTFNPATKAISYPGDPDFYPEAMTTLHDKETIYLYPSSWVLILQQDGSYVISRLD